MRPGRVHARADAARVGDGELLLCCIRRDDCWEDASNNDEASGVQGAGWRGHAGSLDVEGRLKVKEHFCGTRSMKALALLLVHQASANPALAATPPMGWMSWEIFRCETDCANHPDACIDERLYKAQAQALVDGGYLAAGYETISIDDCWESFARVDGELVMNETRFPSGGAALGDALAALGVRFGIYSDEGGKTCGGYPGSEGFEAADAATFAGWGVGYCVEINHWFGGSPPNFRTLYLGQIEVDSADFWTDRLLSSSSRSTAESLASKRSHTRTLKSC